MSGELIERLREGQAYAANHEDADTDILQEQQQLLIEAADEITRLRAELSSLRGEADVIGRLVGAIGWLESNTQCELSHRHDFAEDDPVWQVHAVNGGLNDREWTLIGEGETIVEAIDAARQALASLPNAISFSRRPASA